jgi:hypothetical protein
VNSNSSLSANSGKIFRALIVLVGGSIVLGIPYFAGVYSTLFETNMCYSSVIHAIDEKAEAAIAARTPSAATEYRELVKSLPLAGYETSCDAVAKQLKIEGFNGARLPDTRHD